MKFLYRIWIVADLGCYLQDHGANLMVQGLVMIAVWLCLVAAEEIAENIHKQWKKK